MGDKYDELLRAVKRDRQDEEARTNFYNYILRSNLLVPETLRKITDELSKESSYRAVHFPYIAWVDEDEHAIRDYLYVTALVERHDPEAFHSHAADSNRTDFYLIRFLVTDEAEPGEFQIDFLTMAANGLWLDSFSRLEDEILPDIGATVRVLRDDINEFQDQIDAHNFEDEDFEDINIQI